EFVPEQRPQSDLQFFYDAATSGELNQVTLPTGGSLGWGYTNFTYLGSRAQPEVQTRSTYDGAATLTYATSRDPGDSGRPVHYWADWYDPSGTGDKAWLFNTSGPYIGLVATYLGGSFRATSRRCIWITPG